MSSNKIFATEPTTLLLQTEQPNQCGRWFRHGSVIVVLPPQRTTTREETEFKIPAAVPQLPMGSACAYFFKGAGYVRYNIATDAVDVGPVEISRFWNLPREFQSDIDAALNWGDGHVYLFKGAGYVRYNIATDAVDVGPVAISTYWKNLPKEFQSNIDAAVNWGNGKVYFFKGAGYIRYDIGTDMVDVGPAAISRFWNLPPEFQRNIRAAVNWGNGKVYFFKRGGYVRYDIATDMVDVGPASISRFWNFPTPFQFDIDAAVNWTFPCDLAALMRAAGLRVNEVGNWRARHQTNPSDFTPVGIIMHHTKAVGPGSLQDIVHNIKANFHVEKNAVINIVSGGRANHAGKGAREVLDEVSRGIAPRGTAIQRGVHNVVIGNGFFYGFENENRGDGVDPWPSEQLDTMATAAAALCHRHCWSAERVISHAEWQSGKPDPSGIDMNQFRSRIAELL